MRVLNCPTSFGTKENIRSGTPGNTVRISRKGLPRLPVRPWDRINALLRHHSIRNATEHCS